MVVDMQEIKDEFEKQLFERADNASTDIGDGASLIVETPEMKKAKANVARILADMMKRQQEELDANKFDVLEVQQNKDINVGDIKVTDNYLSKFDGSDYYKIRLNNFEGPLDLLLYLIKDSKVEIEDIQLASITEQYLDYMKDIDKVADLSGRNRNEILTMSLEFALKHTEILLQEDKE